MTLEFSSLENAHNAVLSAIIDNIQLALNTRMVPIGPSILVCGSRSWSDLASIEQELRFRRPALVLHGGARGADTLAGIACGKLGIPTRVYEADWRGDGRRAGLLRNRWMLEDGKPDLVLAFCDGKSAGTGHMIRIAREAGVAVVVVRPAGGGDAQ